MILLVPLVNKVTKVIRAQQANTAIRECPVLMESKDVRDHLDNQDGLAPQEYVVKTVTTVILVCKENKDHKV